MALPFELLVHICAMLAVDGDNATLGQCALARSRLTADCQRYMFATASISFFNRHCLYKLQEALKTNSQLKSYIKKLMVLFDDKEALSHPGLDQMLGQCTRVSCLTIGYFSGRVCDWSHGLPVNLRLALESIIRSKTLVDLSIHGFDLPIADLFSSQVVGISSFRLTYGAGYGWKASKASEKGPYNTLRFLQTNPSVTHGLLVAETQDGQPVFDFTHLDTFSVDYTSLIGSADYEPTKAMLHRATHLKHFSLKLSSRRALTLSLFSGPGPLQCCSTLRDITFDLKVQWQDVNEGTDISLGTLDEMRLFPSENLLESVFIVLTIGYDGQWVIDEEKWLCLATTFDNTSFPRLKEVVVNVTLLKKWSWDPLEPDTYHKRAMDDLRMLPFGDLRLRFAFSLSAESR